jgi:hypothetical protein
MKKTEAFRVDGVFSCDLYSRHFASKMKLTSHKASKHRNNRVECKICGRSLFDKHVLKKHMKPEVKVPKKRTPTEPVETRICDHCGKLVNQTAFRSHMRRQHHDGSKTFQCDNCPAFYFLKERLVQHMVKHIPRDVRQKHPCRICKQTFVSRLGRANHMKLRHEITEKNFKCQFCEVNV